MTTPNKPGEETLARVLQALQSLRISPALSEYDLHAAIAAHLAAAGFQVAHEVPIAPRRRIDFVCEGVGIEIKRGKPVRAALLSQLTAYAQSNQLDALILVVERSAMLPRTLCGKPLAMLSLNRLWGIAL